MIILEMGCLNLSIIRKEGKKIIVIKSPGEVEKENREARIKERQANPKANPTNREIIEYLNDIVELIKEIKSS